MRLQLTLLLILLAATAHADNTFAAKTQLYVDSDHTTVVSPLVSASHDAWKGGTVSARWVADVVSSASVDVVSNATAHMKDFRNEATFGVQQKLRDTTLSASYIYSRENDYQSHNATLGLAQDFLQHTSTLSLGWNVSENAIGRTGDAAFHRTLFVTGASVAWTQVITKTTVAQASYTYGYGDGYQASPYRFVPVYATSATLGDYKVPETDPTTRHRHALTAELNQHLFRDSALHADYRFYVDSWGLLAHTASLAYTVHWRDLSVRLRDRFYQQNGASFYKERYTTVERYMTRDRELSNFLSNGVGLRVAYRIPKLKQQLEVEAKGDFYYFHYDDFALLASRLGGTAELGMDLVY